MLATSALAVELREAAQCSVGHLTWPEDWARLLAAVDAEPQQICSPCFPRQKLN